MANEFKVKKGLIVTGSGSTIFDVQGSQGQLFSVTDSLTGVLFSVNDISGIPIFTVSSDDSLTMGTYGAEAIKINGSSTTINNLIISGTTLVTNLNADLLDGNHASYFINTSNIGSQSVNYASSAGNADTIDSYHETSFIRLSPNSSSPTNANFAIGNASSRNFIQSHSGQPLDINPLGNGVTIQGSAPVLDNGGSYNISASYASNAGYASSAGNADTWGGYYLPTRNNWSSYNSQEIVVGQLAWRGYGNGYTIFDASGGLSPDNSGVDQTNPNNSWTAGLPTLMGWDGNYTSGVRVDSAKASDYASYANDSGTSSQLNDLYNGGYLIGNYSSYGSFLVSGKRSGYAGFEFNSLNNGNVALMLYESSNESGFYNTSYGWQTMWSAGSLYVFKNNYGGGTQATVLDSSNYTSYSVYGSGTNLYIPRFNGSKSVTNSQLYDNGTNVGLNTTSMSGKFHVNGVVGSISIYASGDIVAYSDQSVKKNIRSIDNVLERVVNSRGVIYDRIDIEANDNIGFIAQELEVQFPELVSTSEDGTKAVKYQNATAVLFEAVKEQQKQIDELNEKINNILKLIEK